MNFLEIANKRQSCRNYDTSKQVEQSKIDSVIEAGRLSPSACNSQPYFFTVCTGAKAKEVAKHTTGIGINTFTQQAPVIIVISESEYNKTAAIGVKFKKNDYRSIDIGIAAAYMTAEATSQGLGTCIIGWFDDYKIRTACGIDSPVRLLITLGYPDQSEKQRIKKRKTADAISKSLS